ncbi:MAG: ABC transporter permease subunit [Lachnospiraceae bacterium]|nr:ABC transporter permease subunit [Lachnospiraceae bacterium]
MTKLLSANFLRLKKNKVFWGGLILMAAWGIFMPVKLHMDAAEMNYADRVEDGFFACAMFVGIITAVFCSLFIGTEYNDGTMRNKIIVGGKRSAIYLAGAAVSCVAGLAMCAAYLLPYLCVGMPLMGAFSAPGEAVFLTTLTVLLLAAALSSVFTCIAMVCQNKAATAVICILLAFGALMSGMILNQMLEAPPMHTNYSLDENGEMSSYDEPNPKYLVGMKREIVQTLYDINPGGQAFQCAGMTAMNPLRLPLYSLGIIVLATGAGCALFRKRDLK